MRKEIFIKELGITITEGNYYKFKASDKFIQHKSNYQWCKDWQLRACSNFQEQWFLSDTYWSDNESIDLNDFIGNYIKPGFGVLEFWFDPFDYKQIEPYNIRKYLPEDILEFSRQHGSYRQYFVKKTAKEKTKEILDQEDSKKLYLETMKSLNKLRYDIKTYLRCYPEVPKNNINEFENILKLIETIEYETE